MPDDKPGEVATETPVEDPVAAQLADIERMKQELAAERQQTQSLNETMSNLANAISASNAPPEPEPVDMPENVDEDQLRAFAELSKRQLAAYHNELAPQLQATAESQFQTEWERIRNADPKNFGRMEDTMKQHFDKNPTLKRPGAVEELFIRMRGAHYVKLQEMDAAERHAEPSIDPGTSPVKSKSNKGDHLDPDELNSEEWGVIKNLGGVTPEHYYLQRYNRKPNFADGYLEQNGFKPMETK